MLTLNTIHVYSKIVGWQDPKQRRMFSADELGDLFTLGDDGALDGFTDTVDLFQVHLSQPSNTAASCKTLAAVDLTLVALNRFIAPSPLDYGLRSVVGICFGVYGRCVNFSSGPIRSREKGKLMLRRESSGEHVGDILQGLVVSREKTRKKPDQDEARVRLFDKENVPVRHHFSERKQYPWNKRAAMRKARAPQRMMEAVQIPRVMTTLSCKRFMTVHRCPACSITIWRKVCGCAAIGTSANYRSKFFRFRCFPPKGPGTTSLEQSSMFGDCDLKIEREPSNHTGDRSPVGKRCA